MTLVPCFFSTAALILYSLSYFFNSKKRYLTLQLTGNAFLSVSYLLIGSYFTMVSVAIGIARGPDLLPQAALSVGSHYSP